MNTIVKDEILPSKVELTGSQRAQLEERLQRARAATGRSSEVRAIPRRTSQENLPLSFAQEGLWFLDQLEPGSAVYNLFQALRMKGVLDVGALERALNEIVRRHEVLRTNFVAADGAGVQVIAPTRSLAIVQADISDRPADVAAGEVKRILHEESRRPFDFTRDLLLRVLLVRLSAEEHVLMLTMHHIISDGWSLGLLFRELAALYTAYTTGAAPALPELPIQFADFAVWERATMREAQFEKSLAFWRRQLSGNLPALELPFDHPRPAVSTSRGGMQTIDLPRPLSEALKNLGQQEGGTLYMTLLAAFKVLLHRWTGQDDVVVGSCVAGRRKVELERLIGFFVNTIVLRSDLAGNPTFRQLLGRVRDGAVAAMAHQDLPFERLVKELRPDRTLSRNPLFQVLFVLQNAPMAPTDLPGLTLEPIDVDNATTKFDLTLSMLEAPQGLRAGLEYNADLFEPATISRLLGCFQTLLESIVAHPDTPIEQLALLTPAERHQVVTGWNRTWSDYPRDKTVAQLFEAQALRTPHAVAVVFGDQTLTYDALDRRANQLARRLQRAGVGPDTLVALCLERSLDLIVALIGILKAGGAYVSLDPAYPAERLGFMLADGRPPVLLTQESLRSTVAAAAAACETTKPAEVIYLDSEAAALAAENDDSIQSKATPDSLAYVSYTSGSTGRPKGVCIPHRGVVRLVRGADFAHFDTDDVFLQLAPIAFDASTLEIWGALLNGARLIVHPPGVGSSRVDLQACKLEYSIVSPK